jgi:hypothetical protein
VEATVGGELAARREAIRAAAVSRRERMASLADPLEAATNPSNPSNSGVVSGASEPSSSRVLREPREPTKVTEVLEAGAFPNQALPRRANTPVLVALAAALGIAAGTLLGYAAAHVHPASPPCQCR